MVGVVTTDGPPKDVEGECNARLYLGDDYGDNRCTIRCQLAPDHDGKHTETFARETLGAANDDCSRCGGKGVIEDRRDGMTTEEWCECKPPIKSEITVTWDLDERGPPEEEHPDCNACDGQGFLMEDGADGEKMVECTTCDGLGVIIPEE